MPKIPAIIDNSEISVAVLTKNRQFAKSLRRLGWAVEVWSIRDISRSADSGVAPRVVILDSEFAEQGTIGNIKTQHPLGDIVVLRERASGPFVQQMLAAGATEVLFTRNPPRVHEALTRLIDNQMLLPAIEDLSKLRQRTNRFEGMYSRSDVMWDIFGMVLRVAPTDATVLITGETGTGKSQLARAIHNRSGKSGRFVTVNCAAIQPELIESELFGHTRGAFTGAHRDKTGLFQHAQDGTLLLDEIGDMPADIQLSLLGVLQEQRIRPVGATQDVPVNARIVAATNSSLETLVESGEFREDLFYRLNVVRFEMPSLRQRPEDILYLFGVLLTSIAKRYRVPRPELEPKLIAALCDFDWPGNIRQLENVLEQLILKSDRTMLTVADLAGVLPHRETLPGLTATNIDLQIDTSVPLREAIEDKKSALEKAYLHKLLHENQGRIIQSARQAGISRRTLQRKMSDYNLDKSEYK